MALDASKIAPYLSSDRLGTYMRHCGGDLVDALRLYEWNNAVTGAFWESLAHFEVVMRNVLDRQMAERHRRLGRAGDWLDDPARELSEHARRKVSEAKSCVRGKRKQMCHGQIVSELPFGFWRFLLKRQHRTTLWPDLAAGFPYASSRSAQVVEDPVTRLHDVRNRLAHHERVWALPLDDRYQDLLKVLGFIDPVVRDWVADASRVPDILAARPRLTIPPN